MRIIVALLFVVLCLCFVGVGIFIVLDVAHSSLLCGEE